MSFDWHLLVSFLLAVGVVQITPGPGMVFILVSGSTGGSRGGVAAALGAATGTAVHTMAAALGLAAVFRAAPPVYDGVRLAGAAYLLWLAAKHLRSRGLAEIGAGPPRTARRVFARSLANNLANPKVVLFFVAFLPQFIVPAAGSPTAQFLVLGAIFVLVGVALDVAIGLSAGKVAGRLKRSPRTSRLIDRAAGCVLAGLGLRLALDHGR